MKHYISSVGIVVMLIIVLAVTTTGETADYANPYLALAQLKASYPKVTTYYEGSLITRIYGQPFGNGASPKEVAEQFRLQYSGIFGVEQHELSPVSLLFDGRHTQPVKYIKETGQYQFTLIYYSQYNDNIPVFRADLRLLIRNEMGYPLVLAASSLRDLSNFTVPGGVGINALMAENAARSFSADFVNFTKPRLVIWAGINKMEVTPAPAMEIIADNGLEATSDYAKRLFLVDAQTGDILYNENLIVNTDITGNVSGNATEGNGADICGLEVRTPMPYSLVYVQGGNTAYADENGDFIISHGGDAPCTVISEIRGEWFNVNNYNGSDAQIALPVTPPGPAEFMHNPDINNEYNRAEVNAYIHANVVRDFTLTYNPDYPGLQQNEFPVNVNLNDNCNAYYDYSSINFFTSGGGCPNTAFSTVVHHEYGHHLVNLAGSGQGQYGEGMGDVMGVMITDDSGLAYGFYNNCNEPLRNADNNIQYPCTDAIHYCGQLLSGCVWDIRNALVVNYPDTYTDIIGNLAVNAMLMHTGDLITPSITIDYLTIDDDDGNIGNGTPHFDEICTGFNAHNMDCPELVFIDFAFPDGFPDMINPNGGATIRVEVIEVVSTPEPGTGEFYYNDGSGWVQLSMNVVEPNIYDAVFPAIECGNGVKFYFSAETDDGDVVNNPSDAPQTTYSTISALGFVVTMEDNFETDLGWTVVNNCEDGEWERGDPAGWDRGDPPTDYDGSGQCYVTDNDLYDNNSDVDGGYTYLISPRIDFSTSDGIINYALWYSNNSGDNPNSDLFVVYVRNSESGNWIEVETFGPSTSEGWVEHSFIVGNFIEPTAHIQVRFEVSDLGGGSIVEAGIDAFSVELADCDVLGYEYLIGDANMYNGDWPPEVVGSDVTYTVNYFRGLPTNPACLINGFWMSGDANGDCNVIGSDVTRLVLYFRGLGELEHCPDYESLWHTPDDLPDEVPSGWPNCDNPPVTGIRIIPIGNSK